VKWRDRFSWVVTSLGLLVTCPLIRAEQITAQYSVASWGHKDGLPSTFVLSIAQTSDGFLWLGTDDGLVRFDGVQFTQWRPAMPKGELPGQVRVVRVSPHGELLFGTGTGLVGIMRKDEVEATQLDTAVDSIQDAADGSVWVATNAALWHLAAGTLEPTEPPIQLPAGWASGPLQGGDGREWIATQTGLFYVDAGRIVQVASGRTWLLTAPSGHPAWLDQNGGLHLLGISGAQAGTRAIANSGAAISTVMADSNGCLWIGTAGDGVLRVPSDPRAPVQHYTRSDGLSSGFIRSIFEDREHNIWVATEDGLNRFRRNQVLVLTRRDGLISNRVNSIAGGNDGSVWLATADGLQRFVGGQNATYRPGVRILSLLIDREHRIWAGSNAGLLRWEHDRELPTGKNAGFTAVTALAADSTGALWFVDADKGVFREERGHEPVAVSDPAVQHGRITAIASGPGNSLWFGLANGNVVEERQSKFHMYSADDGLSGGAVHGLAVGSDGELWVATERGLCFWQDTRFTCRDSSDGLPGNRILWAQPDTRGNLWLGYSVGVARVNARELKQPASDGSTKLDLRFFDDADGIADSPDRVGNAPAALAQDGRLWLTTSQGVAVLDPREIQSNLMPPSVHILGLDADGRAVNLTRSVMLHPLTRSLQFYFTGVCMTVPRKVQFRYKLERFDSDWRDGGFSREATYTNLPPGHYTFRVRAANNDGVWNNAGAELSFDLAPAWFQTLWFRLLCIAGVLLAAVYFFRLRLRSARRMLRVRFEERMEERTRIAQDLHDHLIQEMTGISMQLEAADELTPSTADAKKPLQRALTLSRETIAGGRLTLHSLRQRPITGSALLEALRRTADAYPHHGARVEYEIEGEERLFRSEVAEELCDLGQEALRNALKHAGNVAIRAQLRYSSSSLEMLVRDEGPGMTADVQRAGKPGHYGLAGMRERATRIGGLFSIISGPGQGTSVLVSVPAARAYQDSRDRADRVGRRRNGAEGASR
jgi:signal transduction histidine kinase/ligand-binding sensor domain-containing protein